MKKELEEKLYKLISEEMESGVIDKALWTKSLSKTKTDNQRTESIYIELRLKKLEEEYWEKEKLIKKIENERKLHEEVKNEEKRQQTLINSSESIPISGKGFIIFILVIIGLVLLSFVTDNRTL